MDTKQALGTSERVWKTHIVPTLEDYIRIPNKSPGFDPDWKANGHMDRAVELLMQWAEQRAIPRLTVEKHELEGRTPVIFMEIPATPGVDGDVLLYGHLDKQPEFEGWDEDLGPWTPVLKGDKLYGRGGADDGYAMFASLTAVELLDEQNLPHPRIVILIEACEESGSPDLPFYVDHLADRIGKPELVVCLDSGCGNYDQLWMTTSLRGVIVGELTVRVLTEGVHSGSASGIVQDSFHILRNLIGNVVMFDDGDVSLDEFAVDIPPERIEQAYRAAEVLGDAVLDAYPWVAARVQPSEISGEDLLLQKTWGSYLTVTGQEGIPTLEGGNVMRPYTTLKLSVRVPPTVDALKAAAALKAAFEEDQSLADVSFTYGDHVANGWNSPALAPWLEQSVDNASQAFFGKPFMAWGEGGTIPFMGMLGEKFPEAQFLITGVLGPHSNAHGPNEFLHIPTGIKLTASVAMVLTDFTRR